MFKRLAVLWSLAKGDARLRADIGAGARRA